MGFFQKLFGTENGNGYEHKYLYSYSGADAKAFAWFPQYPDGVRPLQSLHTISISVHESKGQARALGYRGIKGLARGVRTIAGTMILTVIQDHPLRDLHVQAEEAFYGPTATLPEPSMGWSLDRHRTGVGNLFDNYNYRNRLGVLLPPFNLALQYVSESQSPFINGAERPEGAGCMLSGVEFIDEGQVTSVNDIVTEMTFSFIACDFKPMSYFDWKVNDVPPISDPRLFHLEQYLLFEELAKEQRDSSRYRKHNYNRDYFPLRVSNGYGEGNVVHPSWITGEDK